VTGFGGACNHTGSGRDEHISYMLPASVAYSEKQLGFTIFPGGRVFEESNWESLSGSREAGLIKTGRYTTLVVYTTSVTDIMVTFFPKKKHAPSPLRSHTTTQCTH
jgi:hypothetical protein